MVEYPGYGIYKGKAKEEIIFEDALTVYDYVVGDMKYPESNILIVGRSIGSGPAVYLASKRNPRGLICISAYTSLRGVCENITLGSVLKFFVKERFDNIGHIDNVKCSSLFIHGKKDTLIPHSHSQKLHDKVKARGIKADFYFPEDMTHNKFKLYDDILFPMELFIKKHGITIVNDINGHIPFPPSIIYSHKGISLTKPPSSPTPNIDTKIQLSLLQSKDKDRKSSFDVPDLIIPEEKKPNHLLINENLGQNEQSKHNESPKKPNEKALDSPKKPNEKPPDSPTKLNDKTTETPKKPIETPKPNGSIKPSESSHKPNESISNPNETVKLLIKPNELIKANDTLNKTKEISKTNEPMATPKPIEPISKEKDTQNLGEVQKQNENPKSPENSDKAKK